MIQQKDLVKGQTLTKQQIRDILNKSRFSYDYVKFTTYKKEYITVTFTRDNKYEIATNSRDYNIWYDIKILKSVLNFEGLINFVFKWINKLNK